MPPNYRGLAFLLSLGSLPLACNKDDKDSDAGTDGTSSATDPTGNTGTTGTGTDATEGNSSDPTTPDPTTGATEPQTTAAATGDTGDTGGTGVDPTCVAYGQHYVECYPRAAMYQEYITQYCLDAKARALMTDGQPCADAYDAFYVCLSMLECEGAGCGPESESIAGACPNMTEEPNETDVTGDSGDTVDTADDNGATG